MGGERDGNQRARQEHDQAAMKYREEDLAMTEEANKQAPRIPDARGAGSDAPEQRELSPQARRALAEAEARRAQLAQNETAAAREVGGQEGPDPVRYGDWEKGGIASDF